MEYTSSEHYHTTQKRFDEEAKNLASRVSDVNRVALRMGNSRYKILIAEDDALCSKVFRLAIEDKFKYNCDVAYNGRETFEKFKQGGFDLIFMDAGMPGTDGLESTRLIREYERTSGGHIIIIGQTGYGEFAAHDCYAAGMDVVLVKEDMTRFDFIESLLVWFLHEKPKMDLTLD